MNHGRMLLAAAVALLVAAFTQVQGQTFKGADPAELARRPIAAEGNPVADLLRRWAKEGTAAGNVGDWYDNRDGGHSDMDTAPWPQLQRVVYSPEGVKLRKHWAAQRSVLPLVVFGNSSTSAPPVQGGSNPRHYYTVPAGLDLLHRQYAGNNLYVYPEHRDHDPGRNGRGDGFGDLYPTNTPYLIISQGSSGSDQPFMRAVPYALAAFRPGVKKKLADAGALMPTVQMVFRASNSHLKAPEEYLMGKAHPTVFEGAWVNPLKMVQLAHEIEEKNVPPVVRLKVLKEDQPVPGRDFFDGILTERLADTPGCVARVWRGREHVRRLTVTAEDSTDLNGRPLTFRWVVLRGDADRIQIRPLGKGGASAELVVPYHARRPVAPGSALESSRVDIGVFAHNGAYYSAPAFVTFFSLDSEARTYDEGGRILEIGHENGEVNLAVTDWGKLLALAAGGTAAGDLLPLTLWQRKSLDALRPEYEALAKARAEAQDRRKAADADLGKAQASLKRAEGQRQVADKAHAAKPSEETKAAVQRAAFEAAAVKKVLAITETAVKDAAAKEQAAQKAVEGFLGGKQAALNASPKEVLEGTLRRILDTPSFSAEYADALSAILKAAPAAGRDAVESARKRLARQGVIKEGDGFRLELTPVRSGDGPAAARLTAYERLLLQRFNAAVLADLLYPGAVSASFQPNYVDQRLTAPKLWRDVYHHDAKGNVIGWTRFDAAGRTEFTADGGIVIEKDDLGRCRKAQTVRYSLDLKAQAGYNQRPLRFDPGDEIVTYAYAGGDDRRGRVKTRGPAGK